MIRLAEDHHVEPSVVIVAFLLAQEPGGLLDNVFRRRRRTSHISINTMQQGSQSRYRLQGIGLIRRLRKCQDATGLGGR